MNRLNPGNCLTILLLLLATVPVYSQEPENEEADHASLNERSVSLGLGVPFSFNQENIGINSRFYYNIGEQFCFGPELYYFKADETQIFDADLIAHYIFNTPWLGIYPVAGGNYTRDIEDGHHKEAFGFTWGLGIHRHIGNFTIFGEYTRVESSLGESFVMIGLLYTIH